MEISILNVLSNIILVTVPAVTIGIGLYMVIRAFIRRDQDLRVLEIRAAA